MFQSQSGADTGKWLNQGTKTVLIDIQRLEGVGSSQCPTPKGDRSEGSSSREWGDRGHIPREGGSNYDVRRWQRWYVSDVAMQEGMGSHGSSKRWDHQGKEEVAVLTSRRQG